MRKVTVRRPATMTDLQLSCLLAPLQNPKAVSEAVWQDIVVKLLDAYGWKWSWSRPCQGRRGRWLTTVSKGYPDLTCVSPEGRVLILELKTEVGQPSVEQRRWLGRWKKAADRNPFLHVFVARPSEIHALLTYVTADQPPLPSDA